MGKMAEQHNAQYYDYCIRECINSKFSEYRDDPNLIHYGKIGCKAAIERHYCRIQIVKNYIESSITKYIVGCKILLGNYRRKNGYRIVFVDNNNIIRVYDNIQFNIGERSCLDEHNFIDLLGYDHSESEALLNNIYRFCKYVIEHAIDNESIEDFKRRLESSPIGIMILHHIEPKIMYPIVHFEREYGNSNRNTFDFVTVKICICISNFNEAREFVNKNAQSFKRLALASIENGIINKYGIPVQCLKLTSCILTRASELVFKFDLKEV